VNVVHDGGAFGVPAERGEAHHALFIDEAFSGDPCFAQRFAGQALNAADL
jgi:hypothetical protein